MTLGGLELYAINALLNIMVRPAIWYALTFKEVSDLIKFSATERTRYFNVSLSMYRYYLAEKG